MKQLTIHRLYFTNTDCYKSKSIQTPAGVQVHSTGSNNAYLKRYVGPDDGYLGKNLYNNTHNRAGLNVCANAYIGKLNDGTVTIYQTLPWDYRCWLSGSGKNGNANKKGYIGFEICEDGLKDQAYFESAVMQTSVYLVAYLCNKYNISIDSVRDHHELNALGLASNHADITHWLKKFGLTMNDYRKAVMEAMDEGVEVTYVMGDAFIATEIAQKNGVEEQVANMLYAATIYSANGHNKNLRAQPSLQAQILTTIPPNSSIDVLEEVDEEWARIKYKDYVGYMCREFIAIDKTAEKDNNKKEPTTTEPVAEKQLIELSKEELLDLYNQLYDMLQLVQKWLK